MHVEDSLILPDWPAPANVRALVTTRQGGVSQAPYDSFNLAFHVGDEAPAVVENRRHLFTRLNEIAPCGPPQWLQQVHGTEVVDAFSEPKKRAQLVPEADAVTTTQRGLPCVVMTADCLPVFFCNETGTRVAVAQTLAPICCAHCTAAKPTALVAPWMRIRSPAASCASRVSA